MEETQEQQQPKIRVSAIVVSYNSAPALRRCIEALRKSQQREQLEILVVDCGSRDDSPRIDAEFPDVQVLRMPRHFGFTRARNIGIRTAVGEYLMLLDPDVELDPATIPALAKRLDTDPEAAAVCPLLVDADGHAVPQCFYLPTPRSIGQTWRDGTLRPATDLDLTAGAVSVEHASPAALMVRTYVVKGINFLDQRFPHSWADVDLSFQIWRASKKIVLLPALRAVSHGDAFRPESLGNSVQALVDSDFALGAASFAGKYFGFFTGLRWRITLVLEALLQALGAMFRARDIGLAFSRFVSVLMGQRIDGTQAGI
ncbi:MAG: glycosyltransferase family 2 protein [Bryobacteraceae bacterium]